MSPTLHVVTELPAPVSEVLDASLELDVEVVAGRRYGVRPVPAGPGSRTTGRIGLGETVTWSVRLAGVVPVRHTSRIVELVEDDGAGGARFVDVMDRGLFAGFRHEHELAPLPAGGGTRMTDRMSWRSPLGPLGRLADAAFVRQTLDRLLRDRNAEIARRVTVGA